MSQMRSNVSDVYGKHGAHARKCGACISINFTPWSLGAFIMKKNVKPNTTACNPAPTAVSIFFWLFEFTLLITSTVFSGLVMTQAHGWKEQAYSLSEPPEWLAYNQSARDSAQLTGYRIATTADRINDVKTWSNLLFVSQLIYFLMVTFFVLVNLLVGVSSVRYSSFIKCFSNFEDGKDGPSLSDRRCCDRTHIWGSFLEISFHTLASLAIFAVYFVDNFSIMADQACRIQGYQIPDSVLKTAPGACMTTDLSEKGICVLGGPNEFVDADMDNVGRQLSEQSGLTRNVGSLFVWCAVLFCCATIVRYTRNLLILCINKGSGGPRYINGQTLDNLPARPEEEVFLIGEPDIMEETTYGLSGLKRVNLNFT